MLTGYSVPVAEDEPIIAVDLASAVEDADGVVVGRCGTVRDALELLARQQVAAANAEANLLGRAVPPIARLLVARPVRRPSSTAARGCRMR